MVTISPPDRRGNAISFVQSGLFLSLFLMALSTVTDNKTAQDINAFIGINSTIAQDKKDLITDIIATFPESNADLRWRWSSRLVLKSDIGSHIINNSVIKSLNLQVNHCDGTESPEELAKTLNRMDSGGAIHDTFEADEFEDGFQAVAITMLYFRALLNGTRLFRDADGTPPRTVPMIRINDVMRYANIQDWGCQVTTF
ncbi:hypothetical protein evm_011627 [Chilo suppressalis]|nr:hypothetical protein evm_011627 [Chilo suppressalis]